MNVFKRYWVSVLVLVLAVGLSCAVAGVRFAKQTETAPPAEGPASSAPAQTAAPATGQPAPSAVQPPAVSGNAGGQTSVDIQNGTAEEWGNGIFSLITAGGRLVGSALRFVAVMAGLVIAAVVILIITFLGRRRGPRWPGGFYRQPPPGPGPFRSPGPGRRTSDRYRDDPFGGDGPHSGGGPGDGFGSGPSGPGGGAPGSGGERR